MRRQLTPRLPQRRREPALRLRPQALEVAEGGHGCNRVPQGGGQLAAARGAVGGRAREEREEEAEGQGLRGGGYADMDTDMRGEFVGMCTGIACVRQVASGLAAAVMPGVRQHNRLQGMRWRVS